MNAPITPLSLAQENRSDVPQSAYNWELQGRLLSEQDGKVHVNVMATGCTTTTGLDQDADDRDSDP